MPRLELVDQIRGWFSGAVAELAILQGAEQVPSLDWYGVERATLERGLLSRKRFVK
ncbi:MAG: hypothetical protein JO334_00750 [Verrucomicrobia bacterium]|nr:hypothetical protein [Verrucomicrobiota bacterium]